MTFKSRKNEKRKELSGKTTALEVAYIPPLETNEKHVGAICKYLNHLLKFRKLNFRS